ncbi:MAG: hypothetical protein ACRD38_11215 [Nitrososphaerales archaeon]
MINTMQEVRRKGKYEIVNPEPIKEDLRDVLDSMNNDIFPRERIDRITVNEYAEQLELGEEFPPIIRNQITRNVLDGFHRTLASEQHGESFIRVDYIRVQPEEEYLVALDLNAMHGLKLSPEDKERAIIKIFEGDPNYDINKLSKILRLHSRAIYLVQAPLRREREIERAKLIKYFASNHEQCTRLPEGITCDGSEHTSLEISAILALYKYIISESRVREIRDLVLLEKTPDEEHEQSQTESQMDMALRETIMDTGDLEKATKEINKARARAEKARLKGKGAKNETASAEKATKVRIKRSEMSPLQVAQRGISLLRREVRRKDVELKKVKRENRALQNMLKEKNRELELSNAKHSHSICDACGAKLTSHPIT